ncbi:MAG: PilZ domain-containing protein [Deltaproteobacteria bacterium]|nr:MAG: PilZ domain-containing protein [Deltaproteobacteria bacterium]
MQRKDVSERRCNERVLLSVPQELNVDIEKAKNVYLVGLSVHGAEIACLEELRWDGALQFCLQLPECMHTLSITSEVVWQRKERAWHAGIKFVSLSEMDRQILEAYVDYLKRENVLLEARKTINMHLGTFIRNFERLLELKDWWGGISKTPDQEPRPRYLH